MYLVTLVRIALNAHDKEWFKHDRTKNYFCPVAS